MNKRLVIFICFAVITLSSLFVSCDCKSSNTAIPAYDISVNFDEESKTLDCSMDFSYINNTDTSIKELKFNLFPNAYRENAFFKPVSLQYEHKAYPNGKSYGDVKIESVQDGTKPLEYLVCGNDENVLKVNLNKEIFPNERAEITIDFTVTLANTVHRLGFNDKTVNLGNFFPILCAYDKNVGFYECEYNSNGDPFYSEVANYKVTLVCPSEYVVASSGNLIRHEKSDGASKYSYEIKKARDFAFVLSKNFLQKESKCGSTVIKYYYLDDETPDNSIKIAEQSIKTFSSLFGKYPYETLSVVETPFLQGGMEYPALVYIGDDVEKEAYGEVIVHETAHQWWYGAVGNNEVEHAFLDEGLTEYSVILFYENNEEYALSREQLIDVCSKQYNAFCTVYDKIIGSVDTTMVRPLKAFTSEYEYVNIAYVKGALMFDYLREQIGDDRFFAGLKKYYKEYCYLVATPDDLAGVFEKTGANTNGYFDSWYSGKVKI